MPSFLACPGRSWLFCTISHKPHELHQGPGSEKDRGRPHMCDHGRWKGQGKVCPLPGKGTQLTILTTKDHPGIILSPEDPADAPHLTAGRTLLGQDRGMRTLKCNIRCRLFGG